MKKIEVVHKKPSDLKFNFENPRKISKSALEDLKCSIETLGDFGVIVIDEGHNVISGNQRVKAMIDHNIDIPIVCKQLIGYTEKEKKAINVKANISSGDWDYDILDSWSDDLNSFEFIDKEFNIEKIEEIEGEDEVPEVKETTVKRGDIYKLGNHKLMCGDSTNKDDLQFLMDSKKANMGFTSPPYNLGCFGFNGNKDKYQKKSDNIKDYLNFLNNFTLNTIKYTEYSFINIQMNYNNYKQVLDWWKENIGYYVDNIIWAKNQSMPNINKGNLNQDYEYIMIFKENKTNRIININKDIKNISNVFRHDRNTKNEYAKIHKATFSVGFCEYFINTFTRINSIILDVFCGVGTSLITSEKINRICYGMELDEHYCQVIIDRYKQFTGKNDVELIGNINEKEEKNAS